MTSWDIASFAWAMHSSTVLSRRPSVRSFPNTAVRAPEPSSRTAFTRRSGVPVTSPWIRHTPFRRTRLHSGHRYTSPDPSFRSIRIPRTVTSTPPPRSERSSIHIRGDRPSSSIGGGSLVPSLLPKGPAAQPPRRSPPPAPTHPPPPPPAPPPP